MQSASVLKIFLKPLLPYKEVLDVYDQGLELPDDVTIIWPDDNYGYMKRLSSPKEQKRSGRSGSILSFFLSG